MEMDIILKAIISRPFYLNYIIYMLFYFSAYANDHTDGWIYKRCNYIANALELHSAIDELY